MTEPSTSKLLYSLHELARLLGCCARTVRRMIDNREIKALRIRNRWMVKHEDFTAYIDGQQTNQH